MLRQIQVISLYILFFLAPLMSVISMKGMVILTSTLGLFGLIFTTTRKIRPGKFNVIISATLFCISLYGFVSAAWSPDSAHSLNIAMRIALMFLSIIMMNIFVSELKDDIINKIPAIFISGFTLSIVFVISEYVTSQAIFDSLDHWNADIFGGKYTGDGLDINRLNRGVDAVSLFMWPALFLLWNRFRLYSLVLPLSFFLLMRFLGTENDTLSIVVICGSIAACTACILKEKVKWLLSAMIVILTILFPFIIDSVDKHLPERESLPPFMGEHFGNHIFAGQHRLFIWRFVNDRIGEKPVLGWGMQSSRRIGNMGVVPYNIGSYAEPEKATVIPLHPHNAFMQLRLELGIPGVLLAAFLFLYILWRCDFRDRKNAAIISGLYTSTLLMLMTRYGLWQTQWLATIAIVSVACFLMGQLSQNNKQ